jgi:histidinol-phosphate phosphatase family protein
MRGESIGEAGYRASRNRERGYSGRVRPAVFLDRDDTILANREATAGTAWPGDLFEPSRVRLLSGAGEGLSLLSRAGWRLVVVSNQGGLAAGVCTLEDVEATNDRMRALLAEYGVSLAGVYMAPARPGGRVARFNEDEEGWRKPGGGMLRAAAAELGIDLGGSWMIGDAQRDLEAGRAAGLDASRCVLVGTAEAPDLRWAARRVLGAGG